MNLVAKPIVKNQLWVITDGVNKVGNVEADGSGFNVKIGNDVNHFDSTKTIERMIKIEFERPRAAAKKTAVPYAHWPTPKNTYNNFYDVKRKLHVFTKTPASKCYHAAGYFKIRLNEDWETVWCPKYIFIQRYEYVGPFNTLDEAERS